MHAFFSWMHISPYQVSLEHVESKEEIHTLCKVDTNVARMSIYAKKQQTSSD